MPDGTDLQQFTPDGLDEGWHAWPPDGKWIAYDGTDEERNYDIYLMRSDGSEVQRLTMDKKYEQAPVFVKDYGMETEYALEFGIINSCLNILTWGFEHSTDFEIRDD
jgi:Tol biopolymer transport system component